MSTSRPKKTPRPVRERILNMELLVPADQRFVAELAARIIGSYPIERRSTMFGTPSFTDESRQLRVKLAVDDARAIIEEVAKIRPLRKRA